MNSAHPTSQIYQTLAERLIGILRASISLILMSVNTLVLCIPIYLITLLRAISSDRLKPTWTEHAMSIAEHWISFNNLVLDSFQRLDIQVVGLEELDQHAWYLVIANHQSWTDIMILQRVFNRRIPMLKFFIKQQLIYVPVIGIAWWVLDFPIMKRYSAAILKKKPHLRGKDLETTRRSCERFKLTPVSVLNFLEGTRFSEQKKSSTHSPFQYLLKPKSGGAAMVLDALSERLDQIIDVTLVYEEKTPSFMEFLMGHKARIVVNVDTISVSEVKASTMDSEENVNNRKTHAFLNERWLRKDRIIGELLEHQS